jgi:hypothetical protein
MKLPAAALLVVVAATCQVVIAQDPLVARLDATPVTTLQAPLPAAEHFVPPSLSAPPVTPELWVYSQELRRHDDPAQAVRRKAEAKADQRLARLAAMKWYGYSNSRPVASSIPTMGSYSPGWIGNGLDRYDWAGVSLAPPAIYVGGWSSAR